MMKLFNWRFCALLMLSVAVGCSDDPEITVSNFETTMDENPEVGFEIGSLEVTTDKGALEYSIQSQSVNGAIGVDSKSGVLTVANAAAFDFETNPVLTAVVLARSGDSKKTVNVLINLQKIIWEGPSVTFTKASNADWTLAVNQDKITDKVTLTRQNKGPIYNFQWWLDNFDEDATYDDLSSDFWDSESGDKEFVASGGTKGVRWAILDNTGSTDNDAWADFDLYGTLGDPSNFYSFHNIASILTELQDDEHVISVIDDFSHELEGGEINENAGTNMEELVGKKLGVWLVEEDIYFTLTFTAWGANGTNTLSYTRSTKD